MINVARLAKRAREKDVQVMIECPGHVPLNKVAANVRLAKSLIGDIPYYVLGPLVTDVAAGYDHIASAIGAAVSAAEGVDLLCYLTPAEHLALPTAEEVKDGLIAYRIAAHAGDLVKIRDKAIKWDAAITEARRTLNWEKQIALSINPEEAARIHYREGQHEGNNVPCTMCGSACVYIMLPQQRQKQKRIETSDDVYNDGGGVKKRKHSDNATTVITEYPTAKRYEVYTNAPSKGDFHGKRNRGNETSFSTVLPAFFIFMFNSLLPYHTFSALCARL